MRTASGIVTLAAAAAVAMLAGCSGSAPALTAEQQALLQQTQDRAEIEALMWRYVRALDTSNADAYAAVFTEDGRFSGAGIGSIEGREALHGMVADLKVSREERAARGEVSRQTYHGIANHWIEFTGPDSAIFHSYWMTMFAGTGNEFNAGVAAVGRGADEVVRVDGQWLIRVRNVLPTD